MAGLSVRRQRELDAAGVGAPLIEFEVLDPAHEPDMNGELAGGKVYKRGGKQYVRLTAEQARFYLDSGTVQPVKHEEQPMSLRPALDAAYGKPGEQPK
jgi:hypothetical protein